MQISCTEFQPNEIINDRSIDINSFTPKCKLLLNVCTYIPFSPETALKMEAVSFSKALIPRMYTNTLDSLVPKKNFFFKSV